MNYNTINDAVTMAGGPGTLLANRYRVVQQLGQGGMGSVWLAEDTQLDGKPFAIKMLPSILVANKRAYRQLKDEALVAMRLVHPNIVQIRAFEENDGNPFLVMDYVDGQTLDDYLAEYSNRVEHVERVEMSGAGRDARPARPFGGLPEADVLRILRPIAAALDYAHSKGVVHRDVKPGNVMIAKDGTPYILDFGIAREIQETMTRVTGKLSSGTLLYMSPEQLMGEQPKPAQDVYSFAAMVYECLKGEPPFSHGQIEFQIMNKQPETLALPMDGSSARGNGTLAASVMAGLAKKPEGRPATCVAVLRGSGKSSASPNPQQPWGARSPTTASNPVADGSRKVFWLIAVLLFVFAAGWWCFNRMNDGGGAIATKDGTFISPRKNGENDRGRPPADEGHRLSSSANLKTATAREEKEQEAAAARKAAEEQARQAAEAAVRAAVIRIRGEARIQKVKVELISDADGFKEKKDALAESFARADALWDEKVRRWNEAAVLFTNYVSQCKDLIALDGDRQAAAAKRAEAQTAFYRAENAGAKTYAAMRWNEATGLWRNADARFKEMRFATAGDEFESAARQFSQCVEDAAAERKRREMQAKAEQDAREREAAEAQKRAEKAARARESPLSTRPNDPVALAPGRTMLRGDGTSIDTSKGTKPVVNERPSVNYIPYINTPAGKMYVDAEVECPGTIIGSMGKDANGRWVFSVSATDGTISSLQGRVVRFQYNGKKGKKFVSASDVGKQIDIALE